MICKLRIMPRILIRNLNDKVVTAKDNSTSILNIIHESGIDWMHACGAKGRCTSCKMIVHEGLDKMGEDSEAEKRFRAMGRLKDNQRLACQNQLTADLEVSVAEENKFPHMNYSK